MRRVWWPLLLAVLLTGLAVPAAAQAAWSEPVAVSLDRAFDPQVAVDNSGKAVFAWHRYEPSTSGCNGSCSRVQTRTRSATGTLGPIQTLSPPDRNAFNPVVAVDPTGRAVFAWYNSTIDRLQARARSANGTLSAVQTLTPAGQAGSGIQVGVDDSGNAVFVWQRRDDTTACSGQPCPRIYARARSATGTLSALQTLSPPGQSAEHPDMAVDKDGDAVFVWRQCSPGGCGAGVWSVYARARSANGALSGAQVIGPGTFPAVGVDQSGDAVIAWEGDGLRTRVRSATGALSAPQTVFPPEQSGYGFEHAVNAAGTTIYVARAYERETGCRCLRLVTRARSANGTMTPIQYLSGGYNAEEPQVGLDASGKAVYIWRRRYGSVILGRTRSAAGTLSGLQTLSDSQQTKNGLELAVSPGGVAHAAWKAYSPDLIEATVGP